MYLNKTESDHCIRITISLRPPENGDSGYVGAQSSHPPAPGEDWRRGRDLSDGPATSETLAKIVRDIEAIMAGFAKSSDMDGPC